MKKTLAILGLTACLSTFSTDDLLAQGRGSAAGRGLGIAAGGAAAAGQGIGRASGSINGSGRHLGGLATRASRSASGMQRTGFTIDRGLSARSGVTSSDRPAMNQERIAEHRFQQADRLRAISERNGNAALLETADRMDASALANQQRQSLRTAGVSGDGMPTEGFTGEGVTAEVIPAEGISAETATAEASPAAARTANAPAARTNTNARRGFWFRSR